MRTAASLDEILAHLQADNERLQDDNERLRAALKRIDEFVNDCHRPLGDTRFEALAAPDSRSSEIKAPTMKIEATFEMRRGDREWVGSVFEMTVNTIAQAQRWVHAEVIRQTRHPEQDAEIDVVSLSEVGEFYDDEGEPVRTRHLGQYVPMNGEWEWSHALSS